MSRATRTSVWRWPIVLGIVSAAGLVSALVADGVWDAVSWAGLGLPVIACLWYSLRRPPAR